MGKNAKKGKFQEVEQQTAASAAKAAPKNDDEDDVDDIRSMNTKACKKRQRKASRSTERTKLASNKQESEPRRKKENAPQKEGKTRSRQEQKRSSAKQDSSDDSDDSEASNDDKLLMQPSHYRQQDYKFEEEEGEGSDFEELNVVFDHFNPKEEDFHGIRQFLKEYLDKTVFDVSGLVDLIIGQSGAVGTIVKVANESEVYGLISMVSFKYYQTEKCMKQIKSFVLSKCPADLQDQMKQALEGNTGLIISERMVNMPQEMALPLVSGLFDEIKLSQEDQPKELRARYRMDRYLVLTRGLRMPAAPAAGKKRGRGRGTAAAAADGEWVYIKAEDEVVRGAAEAAFEFRLDPSRDNDGMHAYGLAMLVPAAAAPRIVAGVREAVGDEALRNQLDLE